MNCVDLIFGEMDYPPIGWFNCRRLAGTEVTHPAIPSAIAAPSGSGTLTVRGPIVRGRGYFTLRTAAPSTVRITIFGNTASPCAQLMSRPLPLETILRTTKFSAPQGFFQSDSAGLGIERQSAGPSSGERDIANRSRLPTRAFQLTQRFYEIRCRNGPGFSSRARGEGLRRFCI